jgi:hypothetical protein
MCGVQGAQRDRERAWIKRLVGGEPAKKWLVSVMSAVRVWAVILGLDLMEDS